MTKFLLSVCLPVLLLFPAPAADAQNLRDPSVLSGQAAHRLYEQKLYVSAKEAYTSLLIRSKKNHDKDQALWATYCLLCDLALKDPRSDYLVTKWEATYRPAPLASIVHFRYGSLLFEQGRYAEALSAWDKVKEKTLGKRARQEIVFKKAYCYFATESYDRALGSFALVDPSDARRSHLARYYEAYIHYSREDFARALPLFEQLKDKEPFASQVPLFILQSYFYLHQYEKTVQYGESLLQSGAEPVPDIARLLSEACFALNRQEEAQRYFDLYTRGKPDFTRSDNYYSGILNYSLAQYDRAIADLGPVAATPDSLGQNALYHLGEAYIRRNNKKEALEAFKAASRLSFDPGIEEDALFNYAKLSFDLYTDITVIGQYGLKYPGSSKSDELQSYMATAYLLRRDYREAIEALEAIVHKKEENLRSLQRACLLRGLQLLHAGSLRQAREYFVKARDARPYTAATACYASYYLGEAFYREGDYSHALDEWDNIIRNNDYKSFKNVHSASCFGKAYALFKQDDYPNAAAAFQNYLQIDEAFTEHRSDAYLRLADCAFMQGNYSDANLLYRLAIEKSCEHPDYALFQIALSLGILNEDTLKIGLLDQLMEQYGDSALFTAALFEKGRTYVQLFQYENAERCFRRIITLSRHDDFHARALVELGLIALNTGDLDRALAYYKQVVREYPQSREALNAIAGIENIYQNRNDSKGFFAYLEEMGLEANKTEDEKEEMLFNTAEQYYLKADYGNALSALQDFIANHPRSPRFSAAHFYMAECLYHTGKPELASDHYLVVMQQEPGDFSELATLNYARIQYNLEHYSEALNAYEDLASIAQIESNRREAAVGIMRAAFKDKQYATAIAYAQKVSSEKHFPADVLRESTYIQAKSYLASGQRDDALPLLQALAREPQYASGAEAFYLLCKDAFDAGDFDEAENKVYEFSDTETPYSYWTAQAFVLLGDIYSERGEYQQALATYNSILEAYIPATPDDIHQIVKLRIEKINERKNENE